MRDVRVDGAMFRPRSDGGPLSIEVENPDERDVIVCGFAALRARPCQFNSETADIASRRDEALARVEQLGRVDYLQVAVDFADCMLRYGRDRYGSVHSPLFSNILTREKAPHMTPYPLFAPLSEKEKKKWDERLAELGDRPRAGLDLFHRFDFNKILNYPPGLGAEGPHKVTLYGCDPYEDRTLYECLLELSRITGDAKYKEAAEKALEWFFLHTQGPAGLYPWGEHLGWDLVYDCPTYFDGPSKELYAACFHEVKDSVPFLDILARLPAQRPGEFRPIEKYALGIWNTHFWDKQKAFYDRHGDYLGLDDRHGSPDGFPAHLGAYMRVWAAAYLSSTNQSFQREIEHVFDVVLGSATARAEKYGFVPFTFAPELKGKPPQRSTQSTRLGHHAAAVSAQLEQAAPEIAQRLRRLAELLLEKDSFAEAIRKLELMKKTGDKSFIESTQRAAPRPVLKDLSQSDKPDDYAREISMCLVWRRQTDDAKWLDLAVAYGELAYVLFCDDKCPLPKATIGSEKARTAQGELFGDYYFHGAALMKAFAQLGEALEQAAARRPRTRREQ